jgi:hypothetical protein
MLQRTQRLLLILPIFLLILGCAHHSKVGRLPELKETDKYGKIVVIRNKNFIGAGLQYFVNIDWRDILSLYAGEYTKFRLNPGKHFIGVKCYGGWTPAPKLDGLEVKLKENDELYFIISPNFTCADIKSISKERAKERIRNSEFIPYNRNYGNHNSTKIEEKKINGQTNN